MRSHAVDINYAEYNFQQIMQMPAPSNNMNEDQCFTVTHQRRFRLKNNKLQTEKNHSDEQKTSNYTKHRFQRSAMYKSILLEYIQLP